MFFSVWNVLYFFTAGVTSTCLSRCTSSITWVRCPSIHSQGHLGMPHRTFHTVLWLSIHCVYVSHKTVSSRWASLWFNFVSPRSGTAGPQTGTQDLGLQMGFGANGSSSPVTVLLTTISPNRGDIPSSGYSTCPHSTRSIQIWEYNWTEILILVSM